MDSRTKDWCTALMWSADIGISWKGGSTKYRKSVATSTPFYFHRVASKATGLPVELEPAVHVGVPSFLYAIIGFLNRDFITNSGAQG